MFKRFHEMRDEDGFTLVELLIVIVILGILAGVVVFAVRGINQRGQEQACRTDKNTISVAQEAHRASDAAAYANEAALVTAGFLAEESTLWNTATSGSGYTITRQGTTCSMVPEKTTP